MLSYIQNDMDSKSLLSEYLENSNEIKVVIKAKKLRAKITRLSWTTNCHFSPVDFQTASSSKTDLSIAYLRGTETGHSCESERRRPNDPCGDFHAFIHPGRCDCYIQRSSFPAREPTGTKHNEHIQWTTGTFHCYINFPENTYHRFSLS